MTTPRDAKEIKEKIANGEVKSKPGYSAKRIEKKPETPESPKIAPDADERKSVIKQEGAAHQDEDKKADKKAPEHKKKATKTESATFPINSFVNAYGFLRIPREVSQSLGWSTSRDGTDKQAVTLTEKDGCLVVCKRKT